jgi:murein L,D-transpeptidase YafK
MKRSLLVFGTLITLLFVSIFLFADYSENKSSLKNNFSRNVVASSDSIPLLPDSLSQIDTLLIAHKSEFRMHLFSKGKLLKTYFIALGQAPIGTKEKQGDNRTPEGDYKIIQKSRGPFEGDYSQYLGVAWMRLNYPNNTDAINGFRNGLITLSQKNSIIAANNSGKEPPKNTKLGGGIGIHGWYGEWPGKDQQCLTWGCISMQNKDLDDLYNRIPIGTRIIILPD